MNTYFYELSGDRAKEGLQELEQVLKKLDVVMSTRLLASLEDSGLYLLIVEASQKPNLDLPSRLRVWSFTELKKA
jgi:hypothetical protein